MDQKVMWTLAFVFGGALLFLLGIVIGLQISP